MILSHVIDEDDLAEAIVSSGEYEEIVKLVLCIEEREADSVFTDMLYDAVEKIKWFRCIRRICENLPLWSH